MIHPFSETALSLIIPKLARMGFSDRVSQNGRPLDDENSRMGQTASLKYRAELTCDLLGCCVEYIGLAQLTFPEPKGSPGVGLTGAGKLFGILRGGPPCNDDGICGSGGSL